MALQYSSHIVVSQSESLCGPSVAAAHSAGSANQFEYEAPPRDLVPRHAGMMMMPSFVNSRKRTYNSVDGSEGRSERRSCAKQGCTRSAKPDSTTCCRHSERKKCKLEGCNRGAIGASGFCCRHGGGKRCQFENCDKGVQGSTIFCIRHGGGRRCKYLDCDRSAQGSTEFCKRHGGGRRCAHESCSKSAEGRSVFCKRHGGGVRCKDPECSRSSVGKSGYCVRHGGGRRCLVEGCNHGVQGSTAYCIRHGGGRRCLEPGCEKGSQGSGRYCKKHQQDRSGSGSEFDDSDYTPSSLSSSPGSVSSPSPVSSTSAMASTCSHEMAASAVASSMGGGASVGVGPHSMADPSQILFSNRSVGLSSLRGPMNGMGAMNGMTGMGAMPGMTGMNGMGGNLVGLNGMNCGSMNGSGGIAGIGGIGGVSSMQPSSLASSSSSALPSSSYQPIAHDMSGSSGTAIDISNLMETQDIRESVNRLQRAYYGELRNPGRLFIGGGDRDLTMPLGGGGVGCVPNAMFFPTCFQSRPAELCAPAHCANNGMVNMGSSCPAGCSVLHTWETDSDWSFVPPAHTTTLVEGH